MDILKHLKKLEEKIESIFEPGQGARSETPPTPAPPAAPSTPPAASGTPESVATPASSAQGTATPVASAQSPVNAGSVAAQHAAEPAGNTAPPADAPPSPAGPQSAPPAGPIGPQHPPTPAGPAAPPAVAAPEKPAAPVRPPKREPLEIKKDVLSRIESEIRRIDGRPAFPFNRVDVFIWASDGTEQAIFEAELVDGDRLRHDIIRTLESARVAPDRRMGIFVKFVGSGTLSRSMQTRGFDLECTREQETERMTRGGLPRAKLIVDQGDAEQAEVTLDKPRINIGRLREVVDRDGRVVRRNDLVFKDGGGVNATVSRLHGHIGFDRESDEFRLFDDNSADGTTLFRDGRRIDVPQGQRRGVVLQSGDEIYFGQARVRFERG